MATVATLIEETRKHLYGKHRERLTKLNGAATTGDSTVTLNFRDGVVNAQSYIEVDEEMMHVWHKDNDVCTVERGMLGTTAASHSDGALVRVEPTFPNGLILSALLDEIRSWPDEFIFATTTVGVTWPANDNVVDLTGASGKTVHRILEARRAPTSDDNDSQQRPLIDLIRDADTSKFTSGYALRLRKGYVFSDSFTVRVTYAHAPDTSTFATSTDVNSTVGIPTSANDIAPLGAAARLLVANEPQRANLHGQPQSVDLQQIPPMYGVQAAQAFRALADRRIHEEGARLLARYPYRADN